MKNVARCAFLSLTLLARPVVMDDAETCDVYQASRHEPASCLLQRSSMMPSETQVEEQPYLGYEDARDAVAANWDAANLGGSTVGAPNRFGPDDCVRLSRSEQGTCMIATDCGQMNISQLAFAFMCMNPGQVSTIHSFGKGGFAQQEVYDSEIFCEQCLALSRAFDTNSPLVQNTLKSMFYGAKYEASVDSEAGSKEEDSGGSEQGAAEDRKGNETREGEEGEKKDDEEGDTKDEEVEKDDDGIEKQVGEGKWSSGDSYWTGEKWVSKGAVDRTSTNLRETAYYGPNSCISTYKSWRGTCLIKTQCKGLSLDGVEVGITCLEKDGNYRRYLFGKVFEQEEVFDTLTECVTCTGIGANPASKTGSIPKQLVDEVNMLKHQVRDLKSTLSDLSDFVTNGDKSEELDGDKSDSKEVEVVDSPAPAPAPVVRKEEKKPVIKDSEKSPGNRATWIISDPIPEEELAPAPVMIAAPATGLLSGRRSTKSLPPSRSQLREMNGKEVEEQTASNLAAAASQKAGGLKPRHLKELLKELSSDD